MLSSFVYILLCSDNSFYTGVTENVYKRFDEHQDGKYFGSYTYSRRPLQLVYFCHFTDIEQAILFEKKVKKWSRAKKLSLIEGRYEDLPNLAKKKFYKIIVSLFKNFSIRFFKPTRCDEREKRFSIKSLRQFVVFRSKAEKNVSRTGKQKTVFPIQNFSIRFFKPTRNDERENITL